MTSQEIFRNFASALADLLDCPDCPEKLAEGLSEHINEIAELIPVDRGRAFNTFNVCLLRGLLARTESGHSEACPKAESFAVDHSERNDRRQAREAEALQARATHSQHF